jgi:hypothetical protein
MRPGVRTVVSAESPFPPRIHPLKGSGPMITLGESRRLGAIFAAEGRVLSLKH